MPRARKHLVCLSETPFYHVTSRCVRRAHLCGIDRHSGRSYEHRRGWIEDRVRILSSLFSVTLCAYAIMSNHYHLVVRLDPDESDAWTDDEVLSRWTILFQGPLLVRRHRAGDALSPAEAATLRDIASVYRKRLGSLSWFMKCLNEPLARQANAEDGCTGHFWEARFHSQPLRSEAALLTAMAYVDLNPVRAGMTSRPERSEYTSIKARVEGDFERTAIGNAVSCLLRRNGIRDVECPVRALMPFTDEVGHSKQPALPIQSSEYLTLVDQTGRITVHGKRGRVDASLLPILARIGLSAEDWLNGSTNFRRHYRNGQLRIVRSD